MELEMIINCKVACGWMRIRDKILYFLSLLLWITLLGLLFELETAEVVKFFSSFYIGMVFLVGGLLLAWSHYRKTVFRFVTKKENRRTRYRALAPAIAAKYFCLDEQQVCALQREKSTLVKHGKDGDTCAVGFHYHARNSTLLSHDQAPSSYSEAA